MDFTLADDQQSVADLAERIVADHTGLERMRERERAGRHHDEELWAALVAADLVALALPERCGGGGYGLTEAGLVAEVVGRHVAPVPYLDVVAAGRLLAAAGDPLAADVVSGAVVVPALREGPDAAEVTRPSATASPDGGGWAVTGEKRLVVGGAEAVALVVPARVGADLALLVVDPSSAAERVESTTSAGQVLVTFRFDATPARRLELDDPVAGLAALRHDLRVLRCNQMAGIAAGALALTAEHGKSRQQFGAPIGTFQAVAHRLADAWLDTNLVQATARQAAWRTDHGLPATQAAASASLWACEGGARVVAAAQHVHGGVGVDLDYPVHRYFRWATDLALHLGGASASARDLGEAIAAEPLTIG